MTAQILVVDDDPDILRLLAYALRSGGYAVITAVRGDEALAQWRTHQPDLVLLDLNLPGVMGDSVCHTIKAAGATPIILMTGQAVTEIQLSQRVPGADSYLLKPFNVSDLLGQVAETLERSARQPRMAMGQGLRRQGLLLKDAAARQQPARVPA